jgi:hypothetical protein
MQFQISNFRGIADAEFELSPITLLAGNNKAGKTSAAQAVASILRQEPIPYEKMTKALEKEIVRTGAKTAMIQGTIDDASLTFTYPDKELKTEGTFPFASGVAVGLEAVMDMRIKERIDYFSQIMKALPTEADLRDAIKDAELTDEQFQKLWKQIDTVGWDSTYKHVMEKATEKKGQWKYVTGGEQYGKNKAEKWYPENWEPMLLNAKPKDLEQALKQAEEWVKAAERHAAIEESEMEKIQEEAGKHDANLKAYDKALKAFEDADDIFTTHCMTRDALQDTGTPCPNCKTMLKFVGNTLEAVENQYTKAEFKRKLKEINERIDTAYAEKEQAQVSLYDAKLLLKQSADAQKRIGQLTDRSKLQPEHDLADVTMRYQIAKQRVDCFKAKAEADQLHASIQRSQILIKALAPDGLRVKAMENAIAEANEWLMAVHLEMTDDMNILYDGRPFELLSQSEQWWMNAMLQIFVAQKEEAPLVILDGADILDGQWRNELFTAIVNSEVHALVCMTMNRKEQVPDLSKIGGTVFWVEGGKVEAISHTQDA